MIRTIRRSLTVLGSAALIGVLAGGVASAADPVTVGLSDVKAGGTSLTGVLTLRSAGVVEVEPGTLKAWIDDDEVQVSVLETKHVARTAMLAIDTSGSMGTSGMATVRTATRAYLKEAPADVRVGVVTFANTAGVDLAPTQDRAAVQRVVDGISSRGDTSLYAGVAAAVKSLGTTGDRSIVLLSDGADTISRNRQADLAALLQNIRRLGIRVDVVRFNTNDPDAVAALKAVAALNGGSLIAADDAETVGAAFQSAARALHSQAPLTLTTVEAVSGAHTLRLTGVAAGQPFTVTQSVVFAAATAAPTTTAPTPAPAAAAQAPRAAAGARAPDASYVPWIAAVIVGLALFLLSVGALSPNLQTHREKRLAALERYVAPARMMSRSEHKAPATPITEQLVSLGERAMESRKSTPRTMELINRADLPFRPGEWFVLRATAIVVGVVLGLLFASDAVLLGIAIGGGLGVAIPALALRFLAARRAAAFERVLPSALTLVATSLRSGFGVTQSLDAVARDAAEPVAKEFSRALAETRIGTDISDALERVAQRMGSDAMGMTVMALRIQREVGGNLAETLHTTAATLREREALHGQVRALSAEGRLSAYILIALPFLLFFYMLNVNREYVSLLWTTGMGLLMSGGALILLVIGIFWMRRVVRIEV